MSGTALPRLNPTLWDTVSTGGTPPPHPYVTVPPKGHPVTRVFVGGGSEGGLVGRLGLGVVGDGPIGRRTPEARQAQDTPGGVDVEDTHGGAVPPRTPLPHAPDHP